MAYNITEEGGGDLVVEGIVDTPHTHSSFSASQDTEMGERVHPTEFAQNNNRQLRHPQAHITSKLYSTMSKGLSVNKEPLALCFMIFQWSMLLTLIGIAASGQVYFEKPSHRNSSNPNWMDRDDDGCFTNECIVDDCPCTSLGFTRKFFFITLFTGISTVLHFLVEVRSQATYLVHTSGVQTHERTLNDYERIKMEPPVVWDHVHCYHTETGDSTDSERRTVTKHKENIVFEYDVCMDSSRMDSTFAEHPMVVVTFNTTMLFENEFSKTKYKDHQAAFRRKHTGCDTDQDFTQGMKLHNLTRTQLISTVPEYNTTNLKAAHLLSMLLGLNWFFKVWFHGASERTTIEIRKTICISQQVSADSPG